MKTKDLYQAKNTCCGCELCAQICPKNLIKMVEDEGYLARAKEVEKLVKARMNQWKSELDIVAEVRGVGAMIGMELKIEGARFVQECMEHGLLINCTHGKVIRLLPAVNTPDEVFNEGLDILEAALKKGA